MLGWLSDANNLTAISTVVIAVFTIILAAVAIFQGHLLEKQIKLARKEFISTHRPRVRIRTMRALAEGTNLRVFFTVANNGDTDATIVRNEIVLQERLKPIPAIDNQAHDLLPRSEDMAPFGLLKAGEAVPKSVTISALPLTGVLAAQSELRARLTVEYLDDNRVKRSVQAFRLYDPKSGGFRKLDPSEFDSEYEYED